jgi:hypothetical protein
MTSQARSVSTVISTRQPLFLLSRSSSGMTLRLYYEKKVRFQVLTVARMMTTVFWIVAPCSLVEVYRRFRGPCCLHHQGDESLIMEAASTPETSVNVYQTTRHNNPEDSHLKKNIRLNLGSACYQKFQNLSDHDIIIIFSYYFGTFKFVL